MNKYTNDSYLMAIISEINNKMKNEINISNNNVQQIKKNICKQYKINEIPSNKLLYTFCINNNINNGTIKHLITKPTRTISGVSVISIMTSPYPCPHGQCVPCPGGPKSIFKSPQSYMGNEPATMRAIQNKFDPYNQVFSRL